MDAMKLSSVFLFAALVAAIPAVAQVKITNGPDKIKIEINGKPFSDFYVAGTDVKIGRASCRERV